MLSRNRVIGAASSLSLMLLCGPAFAQSDGSTQVQLNLTGTSGGPFTVTARIQQQMQRAMFDEAGAPPAGGCTGPADNMVPASNPMDTGALGGPVPPVSNKPKADPPEESPESLLKWASDTATDTAVDQAIQKKIDQLKQQAQQIMSSAEGAGDAAVQAATDALKKAKALLNSGSPDPIEGKLDDIIQRMRNDNAVQQAINAPVPPPTYDPNDDPVNNLQKAYKNDDYRKLADLAPIVGGGNPDETARHLSNAKNLATDKLSDPNS
ncbi:MAG: hypothetical protein ACRD3W_04725, partial [Terriglobales bacterium]